ncbi:MAG: tetratricopeptide repeat protein, partial [Lentisphaerae bacterium]
LLYRAKALRAKGMNEAARQTITEALRKKKGRSQELLHALLYERAEAYLNLGEDAKARRDFERIYAKDPDYEDVADRLT